MFNLSYTTKSEIKGTIQVDKPIIRLGPITDIHGKKWDIIGIIGKYVQACPMSELNPYYTDTSGAYHGFVSQEWHPYNIEVVSAK